MGSLFKSVAPTIKQMTAGASEEEDTNYTGTGKYPNHKAGLSKRQSERRKGENEFVPANRRKDYATMKDIRDYYGNVAWAWKNYIPAGHLTMIAGVQGQGKSYLAAYIMAVFTGAKQSWPNGTRYEGKTGIAMLVDTEQMRGEYVIRLRSMGVKDDQVAFPLEDSDSEDMTL